MQTISSLVLNEEDLSKERFLAYFTDHFLQICSNTIKNRKLDKWQGVEFHICFHSNSNLFIYLFIFTHLLAKEVISNFKHTYRSAAI